MFVHTVFFRAKPGLNETEARAFEAGLATLPGVPGVAHGYWGRPAGTDRPVIVKDYDYGLTLVFPDRAAQDAYQVHPIHEKFVKDCSGYWTKVSVYDFVAEAGA